MTAECLENEPIKTDAHDLIADWESKRAVLNEKLDKIGSMRLAMQQAQSNRAHKELFTLQGGLFALRQHTETNVPCEEGSIEWILDRRTFAESLLPEINISFADFVKNPENIVDILIQLESGEIKSDEELLNRLLVLVTSTILSVDDEQVKEFEDLIPKLQRKFSKFKQ